MHEVKTAANERLALNRMGEEEGQVSSWSMNSTGGVGVLVVTEDTG